MTLQALAGLLVERSWSLNRRSLPLGKYPDEGPKIVTPRDARFHGDSFSILVGQGFGYLFYDQKSANAVPESTILVERDGDGITITVEAPSGQKWIDTYRPLLDEEETIMKAARVQ